ncbi:hypothetical protein AB0392_05685 [Nonomuraea angiospora]
MTKSSRTHLPDAWRTTARTRAVGAVVMNFHPQFEHAKRCPNV